MVVVKVQIEAVLARFVFTFRSPHRTLNLRTGIVWKDEPQRIKALNGRNCLGLFLSSRALVMVVESTPPYFVRRDSIYSPQIPYAFFLSTDSPYYNGQALTFSIHHGQDA